MKNKRSWLEQEIAEYLFQKDLTMVDLAEKIGFKRQQIKSSIAEGATISKHLVEAISKELNLDPVVVQLTDGTLPQEIRRVCKYHPEKILEAVKQVSQRLKDL